MTRFLTAILFSLILGGAVIAKNKDQGPPPPPKSFADMVACKNIEDADERLKCYDREVTAFEQAQKNEDIIITDREAAREAKKEAFGFARPELKILGKEGQTEIDEVEGVVASASTDSSGKWTITLESGARWQQIDTRSIVAIRPGMKVRIRRAAMGSYFVNVDNKPALRMRRIG
jgi:hypothetical protein